MKILWHSNGPLSGTGYGAQTATFCRLLKEAGHDVAISAFYGGIPGAIYHWHDIPVYPGGLHQYGNDVILRHAVHHFGGDLQDGLIVTLVDVWVLDGASHTRARVANWTPVDHKPMPAHCRAYFDQSGSVPVAMSRFGEAELRSEGFSPLFCPHGVDTDVFRPRDRGESRRALGLPEDVFLVGMVAANKGYPPRKGWPQALQAFARFSESHPDARLFMHTEPAGLIQGVNLPHLLEMTGVSSEKVMFSDQYQWFIGYPQEHVATLMSTFDVLLNPAYGEGFGIPVVEAQACGVPVVLTDSTAMPELLGAGWKVGGTPWYSEQGSWLVVPDVDEIVAALESAYTDAAGLRDQAREFALQYDARRVLTEHMLPVLEECWRRTDPPPVLPDVVRMPAMLPPLPDAVAA